MTVERRSPLEGLEASAEGVTLREVPFLAQVNLRADGAALPLPLEPNTVAELAPDRRALWLGPDEWLVIGPPGSEAAIEEELRPFGSVVDVSANRTAIELRGPGARAVLETGCALDLHPRAFGPGRCAQTLVARAQVILEQLDDVPTYRLLVRGSFAGYLATWLLGAISEPGAAASESRASVEARQRSVRATSLNV